MTMLSKNNTFETLMFLLIASKVSLLDGRVYCQDSQAGPWQALGYSCPITCKIILSAVDRLRQTDYQNLINLQSENSLRPKVDTKVAKRMLEEDISTYNPVHSNPQGIYAQTYESFTKIVQTEQFFADFKVELSNLTEVLNVTCYIIANKTRLLRNVLNDCTIDKPKGYILNRLMHFLNKYADPQYGFDVGMTLIILKHLLNTSNFRYGMMESILMYMKSALKPEDGSTAQEETIQLTSKQCLSIFVPGCYCNKGYVEKQGRCVKPEECFEDPMLQAYLRRIQLI